MTNLSKLVTRWRARAAAQPSDRGLRSAVAEALDRCSDELLAALEAVAPPRAPSDELLVALKGYRTVLRPWLDKAIGRPGTVSYKEWEIAVDRLEAAIAKAGLPAESGTEDGEG